MRARSLVALLGALAVAAVPNGVPFLFEDGVPDGQWVMSGSKDRGVQFWDPITGNAQMMLQRHKNSGESPAIYLLYLDGNSER